MRNSILLASVLAAVLAASGCSGKDRTPDLADPLERYVCGRDDLPEGFQPAISASFTPEQLARDDADRSASLRNAGMASGHVAYWTLTPHDPTADPPIDVVCQALAFASEAAAESFVAGLPATGDGVERATFSWLPPDARTVTESALDGGLPADARALTFAATSPEKSVRLAIVMVANGATVQAVYADTRGGTTPLAYPVEILSKILARTSSQ